MSHTALGNHQAFAELYDLTVRRVYGTVLRVLRSPEHAEEVTQEVYAELWQHAARYCADKGSVTTWMMISAASASATWVAFGVQTWMTSILSSWTRSWTEA